MTRRTARAAFAWLSIAVACAGFATAGFAAPAGGTGAARPTPRPSSWHPSPVSGVSPRSSPSAVKRAPVPPAEVQFLTGDSARIAGRWYAGVARASTVVLPPRRRGVDTELFGVAAEFQRRGFNVLTFSLRDSAYADPLRDSLRYVVLASRWVDDAVAALRAARARTDSTARVFAWGQGLAAALSVSAAAREITVCDALAAENLFRFADDVMRENGTAVIADAQIMQRRMLMPRDEPFSASARLALPIYAVLTGPKAGTPDDTTLEVLRRNRGRTDRWLRPWLDSSGATPSPADVDSLADWFQRWAAMPRAR